MKKAVLFIHGLSAKKEDNEYFINKMHDFHNIDIYSFVLPGHGADKIGKVTKEQWLDKAEDEFKKVLKKYRKVTIVAHSMGTILAVNLASRYPNEVEKLVLISSAFVFGNLKQNKNDFIKILKHEVDNELGTGFEGAFQKFIDIPMSVMIEYHKLAELNKKNISKIKCPTLLLHGNIDNVISLESSQFVYENLKCKKDLVIIKNVRHQVFKSPKKEQITKYIYNFISYNILYEINKRKEI